MAFTWKYSNSINLYSWFNRIPSTRWPTKEKKLRTLLPRMKKNTFFISFNSIWYVLCYRWTSTNTTSNTRLYSQIDRNESYRWRATVSTKAYNKCLIYFRRRTIFFCFVLPSTIYLPFSNHLRAIMDVIIYKSLKSANGFACIEYCCAAYSHL